nr:von Willebrand factor D and EGF domain-containing protein-like [Aedes albopictus]
MFFALIFLLSYDPVVSHFCETQNLKPFPKSIPVKATKFVTAEYECFGRNTMRVEVDYQTNQCLLDYEVTRKQVCCDGYYEMDDDCIAVCSKGCENGRCIAPEECSCNKGYLMVNDRCVPQCTSCNNGNCVAPNQCVCVAGFVKNNAGLCVPKCKDDCVNGICNELNQCVCKDGYFFNEKLLDFGISNNTVCTAKCDRLCQNGMCMGRNTCECLFGYELSQYDKFTCNPVCDPSWIDCSHGQCVAPNKCICDVGYKMEENKCVPECNPECEHGNCENPRECTCWEGYEKSNPK